MAQQFWLDGDSHYDGLYVTKFRLRELAAPLRLDFAFLHEEPDSLQPLSILLLLCTAVAWHSAPQRYQGIRGSSLLRHSYTCEQRVVVGSCPFCRSGVFDLKWLTHT